VEEVGPGAAGGDALGDGRFLRSLDAEDDRPSQPALTYKPVGRGAGTRALAVVLAAQHAEQLGQARHLGRTHRGPHRDPPSAARSTRRRATRSITRRAAEPRVTNGGRSRSARPVRKACATISFRGNSRLSRLRIPPAPTRWQTRSGPIHFWGIRAP